jgi:hypothetical protein
VLGLIMLATTQGVISFDWGVIWPLFPMLAGLFLLAMSLRSSSPAGRSALVLAGTIPLLLGVFFYSLTLGIFPWSDMGNLWPIFPLIVGLAFFAAYLAGGREQGYYLIPGSALVIIAVTFLTIIQVGGSNSAIGKLWPIFMVMAGVLLLVIPRLRRENA